MKQLLLVLFGICTIAVFAQHADNPMPYFTFGKGLGISPKDSMFSLNIRFRMQNRVAYTSMSDEDLSVKEYEMVVRRLRLRLDGFVYSPKFFYAIQFSFSRGDMDWDVTQYPNIVRDAMFFYKPNSHLTIGMGQSKLPGNRQRIISSGDLQFADRSLVNATFTNDRDFGVQALYENQIKQFVYRIRGSISNGEGRNVAKTDFGLMYALRAEIQPLGEFSNGGDYYEADLWREDKPKLALAVHYAFNEHTTRAGGTLGLPLYGHASYSNYGVDMVLKYKGWALSSEAIKRESANPLTQSPDGKSFRYIYAGYGMNTDLSYVFKNKFLLGTRYTTTIPEKSIATYEKQIQQYGVVAGKFLRGHRLKIQTDLIYSDIAGAPGKNYWQARFQIEIGI